MGRETNAKGVSKQNSQQKWQSYGWYLYGLEYIYMYMYLISHVHPTLIKAIGCVTGVIELYAEKKTSAAAITSLLVIVRSLVLQSDGESDIKQNHRLRM